MSENIVIEITPAEAAERAAWMLRGKMVGDGKVSVPPESADEHTVNAVASMLNATWQAIEDEQTEPECSETDAYLTLVQERIAMLMSTQARFRRRSEDSHHQLVFDHRDQRSEAQKRFDRAFADDRKYLQAEDFAGIDASRLTLKDIHFDQCDLRNANFENARLSNCTFFEANLSGANFKNAQMPGTILSSAVLKEANFDGANLCSAQLDWTNLRKALLCNANLQNASLQSANLSQADCSGTDFTEANLSSVKLQNAICIASRFTRANLTNADLDSANLEVAQFAGARLGFASFIYSEGFDRKKHKGVFYERTRLTNYETVSTKQSIFEALAKRGISIEVFFVLGLITGISIGWAMFASSAPVDIISPIQDQPEMKVLKKHTPPKVKPIQ